MTRMTFIRIFTTWGPRSTCGCSESWARSAGSHLRSQSWKRNIWYFQVASDNCSEINISSRNIWYFPSCLRQLLWDRDIIQVVQDHQPAVALAVACAVETCCENLARWEQSRLWQSLTEEWQTKVRMGQRFVSTNNLVARVSTLRSSSSSTPFCCLSFLSRLEK